LVAPFEQLLSRFVQDRGEATTTSLVIASLAGPLAAAEVAMRIGVLLTQRDDVSVLVIDGDPEAALSRRLAITGKAGLSELVAPQDAHGETIYPSATARLHILPRGRGPWPSNADAASVKRLLTELSHDYAWILVAAGDATSASSQALARACRGTYAVAPLGDTDLAAAQAQLAALHAAGARVLGAIALSGH
jgi:Mrp family chromosome partitioning ATPase